MKSKNLLSCIAKKWHSLRLLIPFLKTKMRYAFWVATFLILGNFISPVFADQLKPLTLAEAEQEAVTTAPEIHSLQETTHALEQESIADDQLPDPKLMVGAIDVPANSLSFKQDDMTMVEVGAEQSFPPGHSLAMKSKQTQALATAEQKKSQAETAMLLRNVRDTWLDLYYWHHAAQVVHANRYLYRYLLKEVESQYSTGKGSQSEVLQVQLELSHLDDQAAQIQQQLDELQAQLVRWIGQDAINRPLATALPSWPNPSPLDTMKINLEHHPLLKADAADIEAAHDEVAFAKEQFKPGVTLDAGYGVRQGQMLDGESRSDMVTAQVTIDLPFFAANRQDRRLQASADRLEATQFDQQMHYRDLVKALTTQYDAWQRLSQRETIYAKQLVPEARQNAKAALLAYQSATTDLATVLRADNNQLTINLEQLQIEVARAKARTALLYLEGETQ